MTDTILIKRRATGATGAPTTLQNGELAYNETDGTLWIGVGTNPTGAATSIVQVNGSTGSGVTADGTTILNNAGVISVDYGTTANTAVQGNDSRIVNAATAASVTVETARAEAAEALLAPLASPTFTGVPAAPTATSGTNTTQLATTAFVTGAVTSATTGVSSFDTRTGAVTLLLADVTGVGGAPLASPALTGTPTAPTAAPGTNTTQLATTAFDTAAVLVETNRATTAEALKAPIASPTFTGVPAGPTASAGTNTTQLATTAFDTAAVLVETNRATTAEALKAPLASPALTGTPTAPTATGGTNTTQLATTAFVTGAVAAATTGVSSFNTRTGAVTLTLGDVTGVGGAPLASPALTGTPTAPTATGGTNTTQLASTAFVTAAIAGIATGVSSFNTRTGAVTLTLGDVTGVGGAPLASPTFTGVPAGPTAGPGSTTTQLATTAFTTAAILVEANRATTAEGLLAPKASPALTGTPTAPTATAGTNTTQLATTAFSATAVAVETARAQAAEASLGSTASPAFTGTPTAPTAAPGTNTTQIATTAFSNAAVAVETVRAETAEALRSPIASPTFTGTVTIPAGAVISGYAPLASPTFTGTPAGPTATAGTNTTQLASTAFVTSAITAAAGAPINSPTFTGIPRAPTAAALTSGTQIATQQYADNAVGVEEARALAAEAALGNYTATGTGAVSRTIQSKLNSILTPEDFGAVGNFSADDTAAIQNAANAAVTSGLILLMPRSYVISSAIGLSGAIRIEGSGKLVTTIKPTSNNQIAFDVAAAAPVAIEKLQINPGSGGATGCSGIFVQPSGSGINTESIFRDIQFNFCSTGIDTEQASNFTCDNCSFIHFTTAMIVRNTVNVDAGDSSVTNCLFEATSTTETGILQNSSGGLRLTTNKFLNGQFGYRLNLAAGAATGDLLIVNNSFEGMSGPAIRLEQQTGGATTGVFSDAHIVGNQFNLVPTAVEALNNLGTPGWLSGIVVNGCTIKLNGSGTGINLFGVTGVAIDGNNFLALGSGVTCIALDAAGSCSDVLIGAANNRLGSGSAISNYVTNIGANTNIVVMPKVQSGTGSVTVSGASGNVFDTSATTVTFPWAFLGNTPMVVVTPTAAGSVAGAAISGYGISASLTGFVPRIVSSATGNTVPFMWTAYGDW